MEKTLKYYNKNKVEVSDIEQADFVIEQRLMTLEELKEEYPLFEYKNGKITKV